MIIFFQCSKSSKVFRHLSSILSPNLHQSRKTEVLQVVRQINILKRSDVAAVGLHSIAPTTYNCRKLFTSISSMHQTKIGNFFKKVPAPSAISLTKAEEDKLQKVDDNVDSKKSIQSKKSSSPEKSAFDKLISKTNGDSKPRAKNTYGRKKSNTEKKEKVVSSDDEEEEPKRKRSTSVEKESTHTNGKSNGKGALGIKRKSKASSSEESEKEEEKPTKKSSKKRRKRIVVESSSDSEVEKEATPNKDKTKLDSEPENKKILDTESEAKKEISSKSEERVDEKASRQSPKKPSKETKKPSPKSSKKNSKGKESKKEISNKKDISFDKSEDKSKENTNEEKNSDTEANGKSEDVDAEKLSKVAPLGLSPRKPAVPQTPVKGWNPDYNPSKASTKYDPIEDATWERGQKIPYLALAKTLEAIEGTSSRLKFIEILANYFRSVIVLSPDDLLHSVYLCLNKLAPAYEGVELGIAETNIMKAIAQATGRSLDRIKADAAAQGDLGLVAESSRSNQKTLFQPQPLTVSGVFFKLKEIAGMTGHSVQAKKISMITSMLVACKYSEARYLTRSLAGKLRIGLAEQSLLQALAQACYLTPPEQDKSIWPPKNLNTGKKMSPESVKAKIEEEAFILKSCYCECPSYEILVDALIKEGIHGLHKYCKLTPGIPPRPMLAQPTKGVSDVLQRFDGIKFTSEFKYDGERAQIHLLEDGTINIFSRNQENNTSKYPDIISRFSSCNKGNVKSCILDTEAVAWDREKECILPFQVLSTRKRKDANEADIKVQVFIFAFDLLYLNGENLIKKPLIKRRELLRENFGEVHGQFGFATSLDTDNMEEVQEFLEESIKGNCEGLMVKTLDVNASYELAKRSQKWLKLKKDYMDSGGDSLDLVVIGGFLGKGKRTGTYGGFLLACYDPDNEEFQTICKLGTGFSDEQLVQHSESLKPHIIKSAKPYYRCNTQLTPDHWFDAVQVWEVKCADLSLSPVHTAGEGIVDPQRGISLRFPRFLRIRDDKNVEDATSSSQVADMYKSQEQVKNADSKKSGVEEEDDFY